MWCGGSQKILGLFTLLYVSLVHHPSMYFILWNEECMWYCFYGSLYDFFGNDFVWSDVVVHGPEKKSLISVFRM